MAEKRRKNEMKTVCRTVSGSLRKIIVSDQRADQLLSKGWKIYGETTPGKPAAIAATAQEAQAKPQGSEEAEEAKLRARYKELTDDDGDGRWGLKRWRKEVSDAEQAADH